MNFRTKIFAASLALSGVAVGPAFAAGDAEALAGDAEAGKKVFVKCQVCHSLEKDVPKVGPSLYGVFGRKAGTLASYPLYTDAMKESGVVWNEDTIRELVKAPRTYVKGTRMIFLGLKDEKEIADMLAYLKSVAMPAEPPPAQ